MKYKHILDRLSNFYNSACTNQMDTMKDTWAGISTVFHGTLQSALVSRNKDAIQKALDSAAEARLFHGIEDPDCSEAIAKMGDRKDYFQRHGIGLEFPDIFGYQFATNKTVPSRLYIHSQLFLKMLACTQGRMPKSIVEIGAGMGLLGKIVVEAGCNSYSILDIPSTGVMSGYFLSQCLGEDAVWFYGESFKPSHKAFIFPSTNYDGLKIGQHETFVSLNQFPEMPWSVQDKYIELMGITLPPHGFFFSINHECPVVNQRSVALAMAGQSKLRCASKVSSDIYGIQTAPSGYFEEVYIPK